MKKQKLLLTIISAFLLNGCFNVASSTKITISDVNDSEFIQIKNNVREYAENKLVLNCKIDGTIEDGQLICSKKNYANLYVTNRQKNGAFPKSDEKYYDVSISYGEVPTFMFPYHGRITSEHALIQRNLLKIAASLKKKYKDVKVLFYHHDFDKPQVLKIPE